MRAGEKIWGRPATIALAVVACVVQAMSASSMAAPILLTPAGLSPGETFRFVFVTAGTHDGASADLTDYDAFVNNQAGAATYDGAIVSWQVIGSVVAGDAKDHIGANPAISGVFLVDGTKVATGDGSTGLWSGGLLSPFNRDINGTEMSGNTFTGTQPDGTAVFRDELGSSAPVLGSVSETGPLWVETGADYSSILYKMFGISQVLTVPAPEPASLGLLALGGTIMLRRRR